MLKQLEHVATLPTIRLGRAMEDASFGHAAVSCRSVHIGGMQAWRFAAHTLNLKGVGGTSKV
jgi:hypothetical protein